MLQILYATDQDELQAAIQAMHCLPHEAYKKRVETFLHHQQELVLLYRTGDATTRGHNTNNYSEASIRILKDVVLCRTKAYNAVALAEQIMRDWEDHFKTRLMRHANRREGSHMTTYERLLQKLPNTTRDDVGDLGDGVYSVPNSSGTAHYKVEAELGLCNCHAGSQGAFCKHQALVHHLYGGSFPNSPSLTDEDCQQLGHLALGERFPPPEFFHGLLPEPEEPADPSQGSEMEYAAASCIGSQPTVPCASVGPEVKYCALEISQHKMLKLM